MFSNHSHYWQNNLSGESLEDYIRAADEQDRLLEQEKLKQSTSITNTQTENSSENGTTQPEAMIGQWQVVDSNEPNPYYYEDTEDNEDASNDTDNKEDNDKRESVSSSTKKVEETAATTYKEDSDSDSEKEVDTKEMKPFQNSSYAIEANNDSESVTFVKRKQNANVQKKSFRRKTE